MPQTSTVEAIRFHVTGMTCGACVSRIVRAVRRLDGVTKVSVDLRRETATVHREPALVSNAALAAAVLAAGYLANVDAAVVVLADAEGGALARLLRRLTRLP